MGFGVWGLGVREQGAGSREQGTGRREEGAGVLACGGRLIIRGFSNRVSGTGFRV